MEPLPSFFLVRVKTIDESVVEVQLQPAAPSSEPTHTTGDDGAAECLTVRDLKLALARHLDSGGGTGADAVPPPPLRLIFRGRLLDDASSLRACRIERGSTVHLVARLADGATSSSFGSPASVAGVPLASPPQLQLPPQLLQPVTPHAPDPARGVSATEAAAIDYGGAGGLRVPAAAAAFLPHRSLEHLHQGLQTLRSIMVAMGWGLTPLTGALRGPEMVRRPLVRERAPVEAEAPPAVPVTAPASGLRTTRLEVDGGGAGFDEVQQSTAETVGRGARRYFALGQWIDCLDTIEQWLEASVIAIEGDLIQVHYLGWPARWDEWLVSNSPRIAPFRSRSQHATLALASSPLPVNILPTGRRVGLPSSLLLSGHWGRAASVAPSASATDASDRLFSLGLVRLEFAGRPTTATRVVTAPYGTGAAAVEVRLRDDDVRPTLVHVEEALRVVGSLLARLTTLAAEQPKREARRAALLTGAGTLAIYGVPVQPAFKAKASMAANASGTREDAGAGAGPSQVPTALAWAGLSGGAAVHVRRGASPIAARSPYRRYGDTDVDAGPDLGDLGAPPPSSPSPSSTPLQPDRGKDAELEVEDVANEWSAATATATEAEDQARVARVRDYAQGLEDRQEVEAVASQLAPMLDRFGRLLVDLAPHVEALGRSPGFVSRETIVVREPVSPAVQSAVRALSQPSPPSAARLYSGGGAAGEPAAAAGVAPGAPPASAMASAPAPAAAADGDDAASAAGLHGAFERLQGQVARVRLDTRLLTADVSRLVEEVRDAGAAAGAGAGAASAEADAEAAEGASASARTVRPYGRYRLSAAFRDAAVSGYSALVRSPLTVAGDVEPLSVRQPGFGLQAGDGSVSLLRPSLRQGTGLVGGRGALASSALLQSLALSALTEVLHLSLRASQDHPETARH